MCGAAFAVVVSALVLAPAGANLYAESIWVRTVTPGMLGDIVGGVGGNVWLVEVRCEIVSVCGRRVRADLPLSSSLIEPASTSASPAACSRLGSRVSSCSSVSPLCRSARSRVAPASRRFPCFPSSLPFQFFADWCPHCVHLHPTYENVAEAVATWPAALNVRVGAMPCVEFHEDCVVMGVPWYPNLRAFPSSMARDNTTTGAYFDGATRDEPAIKKWLAQRALDTFRSVSPPGLVPFSFFRPLPLHPPHSRRTPACRRRPSSGHWRPERGLQPAGAAPRTVLASTQPTGGRRSFPHSLLARLACSPAAARRLRRRLVRSGQRICVRRHHLERPPSHC